jgi:hypothetical protein
VTVAAVGEFEALLENDVVAEAPPVTCGLNVMVKFTLWPAAIVSGKERPLMENSEAFVPPTLTEETVMLAPVALTDPV